MFKTGDTVLVNVPYKNLLDGMSRFNGRTAIINGCPRDDGWYRLDGAAYLEFREDWLSSPDEAPEFKIAIGDTVVVNVPDEYLVEGMDKYNGHTAVVSALLRTGWCELDGVEDFEFYWDWLTKAGDASSDVKAYLRVPGAKDDADKPPVDLLYSSFPRALLELARVAGDGAKKYTKDGWVHVEDGEYRYANAAGRHALKRWIDGEKDPESGHRHLAHQAWNILAVLELGLRNEETSTKTS
jgi:hypothetical protein